MDLLSQFVEFFVFLLEDNCFCFDFFLPSEDADGAGVVRLVLGAVYDLPMMPTVPVGWHIPSIFIGDVIVVTSRSIGAVISGTKNKVAKQAGL